MTFNDSSLYWVLFHLNKVNEKADTTLKGFLGFEFFFLFLDEFLDVI